MIKIIIVDDQQLIVEAWKELLSSQEDMQVVQTANTAQDALDKIKVYRPDIVLLDIRLKEASGMEICEEITNTMPKTKVIGLSLHDKIAYVQQLLSKGAKGYLTKNTTTDELLTAIREVYAGNTYIGKEMKDKYVNQMMFADDKERAAKELTSKEIEVLKHLAKGLTSKEIADEIYLSPRTVETHRYNILKKLDLPNTARLISWAVQNGYLEG